MAHPITVDFIVTDVTTTGNSTEAKRYLTNIMPSQPRINGTVLHLVCVKDDSRVTQLQWLLYNAASGPFVVEVPFGGMKNFLPSSMRKIVETIDTFQAEFEPNLDTGAPGRVVIPLPAEGIAGVSNMWFALHNRTRHLRFIHGRFKSLPRIALLVPMSLRGIRDNTIPVLGTLAPALTKTFAHTRMTRGLYLGVDEDESIKPGVLGQITNRFSRGLKIKHERTVKFPAEWRKDPSMARMYNELYKYAMMDGYDFAIQLQDDARPETASWDKLLGSYLCGNPLAIGAYSPKDRFNEGTLTNCMVSRTHFDIFGFMFNPKCLDTSVWTKNVLGTYAKIINRATMTNTVRNRRKANGTAHIYANHGRSDEELEQKDREHFEDVSTNVQSLFQ
jgi:hypothetical protein